MQPPRPRRRLVAAAAAAASLAVPATALPASTGHSGWSWSAPVPQGEDLQDVAFADATTGYAVGAFGTVLRTDDAGLTWRGLTGGTVEDLGRVAVTSPASFTAAGGCAARLSADGGATLSRVAYGAPDLGCATSVVAALAPDNFTRYVVQADGNVLVSTDGGVSFTRRTALPQTPAAGGTAVPAEVVATGPNVLVAIVGTAVVRSPDGGSSWTSVGPAPAGVLRALTILPSGAGFAVGDQGTIARTSDAGQHWTPLPSFVGSGLVDVACATPTVCLVLTESSSVLRSTDGLTSFSQVSPSSGTLNAVAFATPDRAVAVGDAGLTVVSDDAGQTWRRVGRTLSGTADGIRAGLGGHAWLWGDSGLVASTIDGGGHWTGGPVPTTRPILSASFADTLTGFALESGGGLWRTSNGGVSWQVLDPGPAAGALTGVLALSPQRVLLVGPGQARISSDAGGSFAPVTAAAVRNARDLSGAFRVRSGAVLTGFRGMVWSADGATGWRAMPRPKVAGRQVPVAFVDCAAGGACWVMSDRRRLWVTTNQGRRWRETTAGLPFAPAAGLHVTDLVAVSVNRAYVVLASDGFDASLTGGWVLATTDGGRTWKPQLVASPALAAGAAGQGTDYLLGVGGQVFTSTTGGVAGTASTLTLRASSKVIRRARTVTITGRLTPAQGRERVMVSAQGFPQRVATVASNGRFSLSFRLRTTTRIVAHWGGDGVRQGTGSAVITVTRR